jgi:hypothetical protein
MEILVGNNPPIKHKVYYGGEPTEADMTPTVRISSVQYDPLEAEQQTTYLFDLVPIKSETDIGVWQIVLPFSNVANPSTYLVEWTYEVNGDEITKHETVYVVTPYIDVHIASDVIGAGSDPSDPNYISYTDLAHAERYARKTIEAFCGQKFSRYYDTFIAWGSDTESLVSPFRIIRFRELYANDVLVISNDNKPVPFNNFGYQVDVSASRYALQLNRAAYIDNTVYLANGMVPPNINTDSMGVFRRGIRYAVEADFGWDDVPDEVELATIELMKDYFSKDKIWRQKYLKTVETFDWKFEYNSTVYSGTGNAYVDQLLLPYVLNQAHLV